MHKWENVYAAGDQINLWPYTEILTRYKNCQRVVNHKTPLKILELGCGAGNNSRLFKSKDFSYIGIDISKAAITFAKENYEADKVRFEVGNLELIEFDYEAYDLIFDRAAVTHLESSSIRILIDKISNALKPDGIYLGIDWFSTKHPDFQEANSRNIGDYDRTDFQSGRFRNVGTVHFSDKEWLTETFQALEIIDLIETISYDRKLDSKSICSATWSIVARRGKK